LAGAADAPPAECKNERLGLGWPPRAPRAGTNESSQE
jgi:hypothetical protein